ncbi:hypothetical protein PAERUG_E15_London_28_01_14_03664 [Pseudomonas aeruginosa]|nr:hypothetical protein PAERUG_E15_London_28_01_14_03664 [Pseudomonas aeruginosa]
MHLQQAFEAAQLAAAQIATALPGLEQEQREQTDRQYRRGTKQQAQSGRIEPAEPALQEGALLLTLVGQDPALPAVVQAVPGQTHVVEPGQATVAQRRQRRVGEVLAVSGQGLLQPLFDPFGRHLVGRVDAQPALLRLPILDPGVGVELMHQQVVARRIQLAALVTGHHSRRNARGAQDESHRPGVMRAEAAARVEQEIVHPVGAGRWRFQGVGEGLVVEALQQGRDQCLRLRMGLAQLLGQGARARIAVHRQLQVAPAHARIDAGLAQRLWPGTGSVEQTLLDRLPSLQVEIAHQARVGLVGLRHVEGEQPGLRTGLHDHVVAQLGATLLPVHSILARPLRRLSPTSSVETLHGQGAPVELLARRRCALEADPERQFGGAPKLGDIPWRHALRESGDPLVAGHRQRPQRPQAGEEQEQQEHQRQRLQQQPAGQPQGRPGPAGESALLQADQRRQQRGHRQQAVQRGEETVVEQVAHHHCEETEEHQYQRIAAGLHFHQLEDERGDQQHRPRVQAHQAAARQPDPGPGEQRQGQLDPGARIAGTHAEDLHPPGRATEPHGRDPQRHVGQVRQDHQYLRHQQPDQRDPRNRVHRAAPNNASARRQASRWASPLAGCRRVPGSARP